MADGRRRRTTLQQFASVGRPRTIDVVRLSILVLLLATAGVIVATDDNPFGAVLVIGLAAMAALVVGIVRPSHRPGGVDVLTSSGTITARSRRRVILWCLALLLVAAATGVAYLLAIHFPGGLPGRRSAGFFLLAIGCFIFAAWRLIGAVTSSDLRLDAQGIRISSPVRRTRLVEWDEIMLTTGTDSHLVLVLSDGTEPSFPFRHQATDPQVLRALIDRCSAYPVARARIGDVILGDLLVDATPDGTEPAESDGSEPAQR